MKGTYPSPSFVFLHHCNISLLLYKTHSLSLEKTAMQPLSHNCPIDKKEAFVIHGKTYIEMSGESYNDRAPLSLGFRILLFGR